MSLYALAALAGDIGTREFSAEVTAVAVVERFSFEDRLARFDEPDAPARTGGVACAVTVAVDHTFFQELETIYASAAACSRISPGERVVLQYLGLADSFQFVAVRVRGEWASLPLMRDSGAKGSAMLACLQGIECSPKEAPPL